MSKAAVRRTTSISPSIKQDVEASIESALFTDFSIFTDEPDAMIGIITMEAIWGGLDSAIKMILIEDSVNEAFDEIFNALFSSMFS